MKKHNRKGVSPAGVVPAICIMMLFLFAFSVIPSFAANAEEAQGIVDKARVTFNDFMRDKNYTWLHDHLKDAKGLLIFPQVIKGGFFIGGSGGTGVLVVRDARTGDWSQPAFYKLASVSVGFQIGGEHSQVILFIRSQEGLDSFLNSSVKLGGEVSVAAGPVGEGAQATTADILSFSRSKGAFVGAALGGTVVKPAKDLNRAFYGRRASPVDILVRQDVKSDKTGSLREALAEASKRK